MNNRILKAVNKAKKIKISAVALALIKYLVIICIMYLILFPLFRRGVESIKSYGDMLDLTVKFIPKNISFEHYERAMRMMNFGSSFRNSLVLSSLVGLLQVVSCTAIGYGFGRFNFPLKKLLFVIVVATLLIPPQTLITAQYLHFRFFDVFGAINFLRGDTINLIDSFWPSGMLAATGFGLKNGLYIYLMSQFFQSLPKELEEAGLVDGAGAFRIFTNIMLPCAFTMMFTIFLFSFSWQWTDTHFARLFFSSAAILPSSVSRIIQDQVGSLDPVLYQAAYSAAVVLIVLPIAVLYGFTQKFFIEGIEKSGIVG